MVLQNCVFRDETEYKELYYKATEKVWLDKDVLVVPGGYKVNCCTYMNTFDVGTWKKYTDISQIVFYMKYEGTGRLSLICEQKEGTQKVIERELTGNECCIEVPKDFENGIVYFSLLAWDEIKLYQAWFEAKETVQQESKIALIICTYKRRALVERTIEKIRKLIDTKKVAWLQLTVIDNASELPNNYGKYVAVYHNANTGGSGGFSRGMDEVVRRLETFPATHVVLMDDDAELEMESLIRLRSLLCYLKAEYVDEVVAGRMFRADQPTVQYTAAEIWNGGDLRHIGWNVDMTNKDNIWSMNNNAGGEYSGWWLACYSIGFVKDNRPLPFFLHCDDVEYGLRHGGTPIILNGVQVWHETAEYRQTPVMVYYDVRNSLFVNSIYGSKTQLELYQEWKTRLSYYHFMKMYVFERMTIWAAYDFLKGFKWLKNVNSKRLHLCISKKRKATKYGNCILWRIVASIFLGGVVS